MSPQTNPRPEDLFEWVGDPVEGPLPLVVIVDGWIEASDVTAKVHETITQQGGLDPLVQFDTDHLLDQRARRPLLTSVEGLMQGLTWPELTISLGADADDKPFLYLHGPEPDFYWRRFVTAAATAAATIGITSMYTINAYPVPAPHTRPVRISTAATSSELLVGREVSAGSLQVPCGVQMALGEELHASGIEATGLFAQVPYYISTQPWPQASLDLLAHLQSTAGLRFDTKALECQIPDALAAVESMLEDAPALANLVAELEQRFDDLRRIEEAELPSGDELEEELQQFLRDNE